MNPMGYDPRGGFRESYLVKILHLGNHAGRHQAPKGMRRINDLPGISTEVNGIFVAYVV